LVLSRDAARLKQAVARARIVVVHSLEIDNAGEKGVGPAFFDHAIQRLRAAWRLFRDAGIHRFVITSDHGFPLLSGAGNTVQGHGRKIDPKRRHVLSPVAADHRGEVRVFLRDLGYEGVDGHLMFPETTALFDTGKRPEGFVHGGNSLQERVVPVLTLVHRAAAGTDSLNYAVTTIPMEGVAGMHCIRAEVDSRAQEALDFGGKREVELALRVPEPSDVQVELCQTRGAARLSGSSILATVGQGFELFFRLSGAEENRVEKLIAAGQSDEDPEFDDKVRSRLDDDLAALTGGQAPQDFVRVVQTIFDLKQRGKLVDAGALISWLCGSGNVAASAKKVAGIKGDIESRNALDYLRGVLEIVKAAGYRGLVIVIDEAETILRMRKDTRHKSPNGIRQIADAAGSYPGLLWVFTGTPEFFDTRQGVAGLVPLHERIRFLRQGRFASLRQAQLELTPFTEDRLKAVALRLRELFPAQDPARLEAHVSSTFVDRLVAEITKGFKGDVGVVPRQFLREFVTQMDLVEEHEDYDPAVEYGFTPSVLSPQEEQALTGSGVEIPDADDDLVPQEDVW
jgi:hypothetical protein